MVAATPTVAPAKVLLVGDCHPETIGADIEVERVSGTAEAVNRMIAGTYAAILVMTPADGALSEELVEDLRRIDRKCLIVAVQPSSDASRRLALLVAGANILLSREDEAIAVIRAYVGSVPCQRAPLERSMDGLRRLMGADPHGRVSSGVRADLITLLFQIAADASMPILEASACAACAKYLLETPSADVERSVNDLERRLTSFFEDHRHPQTLDIRLGLRRLHELVVNGKRPSQTETARAVGLTANRFSKRLRQETGLSFSQWKKSVCVIEGARMIDKSTDSCSSQVAYRLGYSFPGHFARDFSRLLGVSPSQFKAMAARPLRHAGGSR